MKLSISFLPFLLLFPNALAVPNNNNNNNNNPTLTLRTTDLKKPKPFDKLNLCQTAPPSSIIKEDALSSSIVEEAATACCKTIDKKNTKASGCQWIPKKEFTDWKNSGWLKNTGPIKKLCPHADEKELKKGLKGKKINLVCITTERAGKNAKVGKVLRRISINDGY